MSHNNRKLIEERQYVQEKIVIGIFKTNSDSNGIMLSNRNRKKL